MNSLVSFAIAQGIKLSKPQTNLLNKLEAEYGVNIDPLIPATGIQMLNRFGGNAATVNALVLALVQFVYGCNTDAFGPVTYRGKKVSVSDFDRARYTVLAIDPNAYSALLD
jgi:hypothetical protein